MASLRDRLLLMYEKSAREDDEGKKFKCRRCCTWVSWDVGSDDLAGLCSDCWVAVDERLRYGAGPDFMEEIDSWDAEDDWTEDGGHAEDELRVVAAERDSIEYELRRAYDVIDSSPELKRLFEEADARAPL